MTTTRLYLEKVRAALAESGEAFGSTLAWHDSVTSTMPLAWQLAGDPAVPSGAAVVADEQTAGKGRQGRTWLAPPGSGLLVSFLIRRDRHAVALDRLHMAAALAVADLCRHAGIAEESIRCKWPNDIILLDEGGPPRKVAGILVETRLAGSAWQSAVIGMGINVNQRDEELPSPSGGAFPATSLRMALSAGEHSPLLDRAALFVALCRALDENFVLSEAAILHRWRALLWIPQGEVVVSGGAESLRGEVLGADDAGALLLRDGAGVMHRLAAGDLSLRPLAS